MEIKIGQKVRDVMTGFTGIVIYRTEEMSGNIRYAVQRQMAEGETAYPEAILLDHHTLDVVDDGIRDRVTKAKAPTIPLGSQVSDKATGMEGVLVERSIHINGCIRCGVVPKKEKGQFLNSNPDASHVAEDRLTVISNGLVAVAKEVSPKAPGGPAIRLKTAVAQR